MQSQAQLTGKLDYKNSKLQVILKDLKKNKYKYLMILPVIIYFILFSYKPMYGVIIAFKNYIPFKGIMGSEWVGLQNFKDFFTDIYFFRVLKNTIIISLYSIIFGFPAPIILALLLNEVKNTAFKRTIQTVSYMPHFISMVIVCGLIRQFCLSDGVINDILSFFTGTRASLLQEAKYFRTIYILSSIWQETGWGTIIYLAALAGIDQEQYEAAEIDGAGRFKRMLYITLPGLIPTIIVLFILRMGGILNVGFEKVLLLYGPTTYQTGDVISTFVYRKGLLEGSWSFSTAVGLFNSVINIFFLLITNYIAKKSSNIAIF
jgi:ABC-type polysaccharide transport system, permease component